MGDQVEIGPPAGDRDREVEGLAEARGRDAVGVEVMSVDQIEALARRDQPPQGARRRAIEKAGRKRHAELGDHGIARVVDRDPVADLGARRAGEGGVAPETRARERKPRHRGEHARLDRVARHQLAQPVLDEHAVLGLGRVGVERGEGEDTHRRHRGKGESGADLGMAGR